MDLCQASPNREVPMISLPSTPRPNALAAPAHTSALTPDEWRLILKALSAYQHHTGFRAIYEKLLGLQANAPDTRRQEAAEGNASGLYKLTLQVGQRPI